MKLLILLLFIFISCSVNETPTAGGTKVGNLLRGKVINSDGSPATGTSYLKRVNAQKNTIDFDIIDSCTLKNGQYTFENFENSKYLVETKHENLFLINDNLDFINNDTIVTNVRKLSPTTTIIGRVINFSNGEAIIAGTSIKSTIDANGFYELQNSPQGEYNISFIDTIYSYNLPVNVNTKNNTSYIEDVNILEATSSDNTPFLTQRTSYTLSPVVYSDSTPKWYAGKDFSGIKIAEKNSPLAKGTKDILLITGQWKNGNDSSLIDTLSSLGYAVTIVYDSVFSTVNDTINAIIISQLAEVDKMDSIALSSLKRIDVPILCMKAYVASRIGMCKTPQQLKDISTLYFTNHNYEISGTLMGEKTISTPGYIDYVSFISTDADTIATVSKNNKSPVIYSYELGDIMKNDYLYAVNRRVGFHINSGVNAGLNVAGTELFFRALNWMMQ